MERMLGSSQAFVGGIAFPRPLRTPSCCLHSPCTRPPAARSGLPHPKLGFSLNATDSSQYRSPSSAPVTVLVCYNYMWTFYRTTRILHSQFLKPSMVMIRSMNKRKRHLFVSQQVNYPDVSSSLEDWIRKNDAIVRVSPALLGGTSFLLVLLNRTFSGIAPVADASSAQSRADVIALVLAATAVLNGLVWISIKPKKVMSVELSGVDCLRMDDSLSGSASAELMWAWKALRETTCCRALVVVYRNRCVLQVGLMSEFQGVAKHIDCPSLLKGSLCQNAWASGKQSYLANLALFPGRFELGFLPSNTQAVILQPLGDDGIMIVAGDTIRGFGPTDQAWCLSISEKLDATLGRSESTTALSTSVSNTSV